MKTFLGLILLVTALSAYAAPKCIRYAKEELNGMTADELKATIKENEAAIEDFSSFSFAERSARNNCLIQNQRISSILEKKSPKKPSDTPQ